MFYDYYIEKQRGNEMTDWQKAERYEYCEQYPGEERKRKTLWEKIKKFFKK